ncbi:uncharacterized protein BX663DRAFT_553581 [Cokeromyces recurvatus]|uniref:uncharacterized protein n=1 Tax=Cokeromyces recurvatus TaxID=90255 RepID=UPI0022207AD4|nr:uncharacterized protein BX663DRAFT_553581 [Cokeromyces recurvatus]KAI7900936.1 hypothetical protein BX663DRAFT_553581 [Cokeromyces recurvatus]
MYILSTFVVAIETPWHKRPYQFRMQLFSRPDNKGQVQTVRANNDASSFCRNLASKRVGSYELNDPLVKITFYRSLDCKGAPIVTYHPQESITRKSRVMIKAKSFSITKVKPIRLR